MRIRKNAKLSPLWFSHASAPESLQAHVCQLNQSPWDVLPLTHQVLFSFTFLSFSFADLPKPSLSFFAFSLSNLHFFSRVFFICLFAAFRVPLNPKFFYFYRVFSSKHPIRLMGFPHFLLFSLIIILLGSAQFEGDDSLTGNASLGDSIGAVER